MPSSNPFIDILPAHVRKQVYAAAALAGIILGAIQVGYGAASASQPTWLVVALAVYAFLGGVLGVTAASNTKGTSTQEARHIQHA